MDEVIDFHWEQLRLPQLMRTNPCTSQQVVYSNVSQEPSPTCIVAKVSLLATAVQPRDPG